MLEIVPYELSEASRPYRLQCGVEAARLLEGERGNSRISCFRLTRSKTKALSEKRRGLFQRITNAQMSNLRSLAAIRYSAIRLSRLAFLCSPLRSKALINKQKMATNMDTNMAASRAASM